MILCVGEKEDDAVDGTIELVAIVGEKDGSKVDEAERTGPDVGTEMEGNGEIDEVMERGGEGRSEEGGGGAEGGGGGGGGGGGAAYAEDDDEKDENNGAASDEKDDEDDEALAQKDAITGAKVDDEDDDADKEG